MSDVGLRMSDVECLNRDCGLIRSHPCTSRPSPFRPFIISDVGCGMSVECGISDIVLWIVGCGLISSSSLAPHPSPFLPLIITNVKCRMWDCGCRNWDCGLWIADWIAIVLSPLVVSPFHICRMSDVECRNWNCGFRIADCGCGMSDVGCRMLEWGLGIVDCGLISSSSLTPRRFSPT
jgi:hypothetical protein